MCDLSPIPVDQFERYLLFGPFPTVRDTHPEHCARGPAKVSGRGLQSERTFFAACAAADQFEQSKERIHG